MQKWSVLRSMAPDTTESREDRAAHSWPHPSLTVPPRRIDLPPYQLQPQDRGFCTSPRRHNSADPVDREQRLSTPMNMHGRSGPTPHLPYDGVGQGEKTFPIPHPSLPVAGGRSDPEVMRRGELAQVHQPGDRESRSADPVHLHLPCGGMSEGKMPSTPNPSPGELALGS